MIMCYNVIQLLKMYTVLLTIVLIVGAYNAYCILYYLDGVGKLWILWSR